MPDNPNTAEPEKKLRCRWFQFRLRTLLIAVALLAILFPLGGWLVRESRQLRAEDRLIMEGTTRH
jgi:hypothetical protein